MSASSRTSRPNRFGSGCSPSRYRQIATDSERYEPSSSSSTGTPPDEFFERNSGVRLCPAKTSTSANLSSILFRREDADPTWIRRQGMIVELHGIGHFFLLCIVVA